MSVPDFRFPLSNSLQRTCVLLLAASSIVQRSKSWILEGTICYGDSLCSENGMVCCLEDLPGMVATMLQLLFFASYEHILEDLPGMVATMLQYSYSLLRSSA